MAIYHLSVSNVSRAKGSTSCATLAYISGEKIHDSRTGKTYSYSRRERVLVVETKQFSLLLHLWNTQMQKHYGMLSKITKQQTMQEQRRKYKLHYQES